VQPQAGRSSSGSHQAAEFPWDDLRKPPQKSRMVYEWKSYPPKGRAPEILVATAGGGHVAARGHPLHPGGQPNLGHDSASSRPGYGVHSYTMPSLLGVAQIIPWTFAADGAWKLLRHWPAAGNRPSEGGRRDADYAGCVANWYDEAGFAGRQWSTSLTGFGERRRSASRRPTICGQSRITVDRSGQLIRQGCCRELKKVP